jgi:hypothetical protein
MTIVGVLVGLFLAMGTYGVTHGAKSLEQRGVLDVDSLGSTSRTRTYIAVGLALAVASIFLLRRPPPGVR